MDPLSVAASASGLITFCTDVGRYLADVKNAPKNAEKLYAQVTSMKDVLEKLDGFLRGDGPKGKVFATTSVLVQSIDICKSHLERLLKKLETVNKKFLHRAGFPLSEKEISHSIELLRGYIQTFQLSLTVNGW
jgi:hypothetical protein